MGTGLVYGCLLPHPPILLPAIAGSRAEMVRVTRDAVQAVADEIRQLSPDVVLLISPHSPRHHRAVGMVLAGRYRADFGDFGHPDVSVAAPADGVMASALSAECNSRGVTLSTFGRPGGEYELDHGAAVPLFFLQRAGPLCDLLLLTPSDDDAASHFRFGTAIAAAARRAGKRAVLVASGDLSHRLAPGSPAGFDARGREFDQILVSALTRNDRQAILEVDRELLAEAGECGYRSLVTALGAMEGVDAEVLSYECPFGVGYLVARFRTGAVDDGGRVAESVSAGGGEVASEERAALDLARLAVEAYVCSGAAPAQRPEPVAGLLAGRAGVFVCLKVDGQLRGCIGTFHPTQDTVADEIMRSAVLAAGEDPRFPSVTASELPHLQYSIDILSPPEPVAEVRQLDPKRYGVLLEAGQRRSPLLPDLPGVDTVECQLEVARRKAGISGDEQMEVSRFTVRRIEDPAGAVDEHA